MKYRKGKYREGQEFTLTRPLDVFTTGRRVPTGTRVVFEGQEAAADGPDTKITYNTYRIIGGPFGGAVLRLIPGSEAERSLRPSSQPG